MVVTQEWVTLTTYLLKESVESSISPSNLMLSANCTWAPATWMPCDLLTCDNCWLVPKITAWVLVGFKRSAFSINHRDTSLEQLSMLDKLPKSVGFKETYSCMWLSYPYWITDGNERYAERWHRQLKTRTYRKDWSEDRDLRYARYTCKHSRFLGSKGNLLMLSALSNKGSEPV